LGHEGERGADSDLPRLLRPGTERSGEYCCQARYECATVHLFDGRIRMQKHRRAIISVVWAALAAAVLAVVEDAWASVPVALARFCDAPNPQHSVANLAPSLNNLIRPQQQRRRDGEAERLGGFHV
jgi:hypothetical protein